MNGSTVLAGFAGIKFSEFSKFAKIKSTQKFHVLHNVSSESHANRQYFSLPRLLLIDHSLCVYVSWLTSWFMLWFHSISVSSNCTVPECICNNVHLFVCICLSAETTFLDELKTNANNSRVDYFGLIVGETDIAVQKSRRAPWKNRICFTTMKMRKSLVKPLMRQKTCNYIKLFGSSAQDRHARRI